MSWKELIKAYFIFSKKDRIGLIVLLALIIFTYFLPLLFKQSPVPEPVLLKEATLLTDSAGVHKNLSAGQDRERELAETEGKGELFHFDPNLLPAEGWLKLGLPERTVRTIMNYREKGGRFKSPEDLKKIWGVKEEFYSRVKSYISIRTTERKELPLTTWPEKKEREPRVLDLNQADSMELEKLPWIGPRLAARILGFREKLGGFHSVEQVAETYGLADSVYTRIKPFLKAGGEVIKIRLNAATKEEMARHPYIRWKLAGAIWEYRKQHGDFRSVEEIKKIFLVDDAAYGKLLPYLDL